MSTTQHPAAVWTFRILLAAFALCCLMPSQAEAVEQRFGIGVQFFKTVDDIADDVGDDSFANIEDDGYALVLSYQRIPTGLFSWEIDVEYYESGFGGSGEESITPLVFLLFGRSFYAGVGAGVTFASDLDDNVSDPFFAARIGYRLDILPFASLDINANYRTGAFEDLGDFDTDATTLGAIVRFRI